MHSLVFDLRAYELFEELVLLICINVWPMLLQLLTPAYPLCVPCSV